LADIPKEIIAEYNLRDKATMEDSVYIKTKCFSFTTDTKCLILPCECLQPVQQQPVHVHASNQEYWSNLPLALNVAWNMRVRTQIQLQDSWLHTGGGHNGGFNAL